MPNKAYTFSVSIPHKYRDLIATLKQLGETGQRSSYILESLLNSTKVPPVMLDKLDHLAIELDNIKNMLASGNFVSQRKVNEIAEDIWATIDTNA